MLDAETKARIDSARDILVGKVPDPKSQVEQITIALIYKFMDDMDRQSQELGGKAAFFSSEFKKYRWANLLDKRLGGNERLLLYAEGLEKMDENKNIPRLFRDIFKGVFLPYRDPETLNLFLKEIDSFNYDHSERLGDEYEYLLSVLGTQGDAGQFRTPRHIIDFIVAAVAPQKHETILDPACGTAGFLISAFKHILKANENLTPDERARLMTNFRGYDIAPDMVRLSRVNLYLHGFPNPVIHEYDTLTSEERWDERCDVIMANPPFMTPKGGIRPHNRFAVKAKRSEVLFVDYIAEHLNPGGRAGVIVPEGIIFQGQNAYKALRKMLVENYLWAVVSLPAGVFNPYSGVKTCILFLDRNLAKRTEEILFVKVENDGFDLGAQRRPIERNDLPEALKILNGRKNAQKTKAGKMALTVSRKRILESADMNLSGDRYRVSTVRPTGKWPMVNIGDLCYLQNGRAFKPSEWEKKEAGGLPIIRIQNLNDQKAEFNYYRGKVDDRLIVRRDDLLFSWSGSRGTSFGPHIWDRSDGILNQHIFNVRHNDTVNCRFFYWMLKKAVEQVEKNLHGGVGLVHITKGNLEKIEIPIPPLEEQERIVAELEGYRKVIEGARQIIANYKPSIRIDPAWPRVKLGEVCRIDAPLVDPKLPKFRSLPHVSGENIESGTGALLTLRSAAEDKVISGKYAFKTGAVLYSKLRPYLCKAALASSDGLCSADMYPLMANDSQVDARFLLYNLLSDHFTRYAVELSGRARMPKLNREDLMSYEIPLPPLEVQRRIVAELEAERALVESNRKLIEVFEKKIQERLAEVWGEDATETGGTQ